jgi:hypothetical protein
MVLLSKKKNGSYIKKAKVRVFGQCNLEFSVNKESQFNNYYR